MRELKIAIVEDDKAYSDKLREYVSRYENSREGEVFKCRVDVFETGLKFLSELKAGWDVVFMDIDMPVLGGMETAKALYESDKNACIIFCTNLSQYAIKGYEVAALDFMVKPIEYSTFKLKFDRAVKKAEARTAQTLVIKTAEGIVKLSTANIYYIECIGHYLTYHTISGIYEERGAINALEEKLRPYGFLRCVSGILVNAEHVTKITQNSVFATDTELPLSRRRRKQFLDEYMSNLSKKS